LRALRLPADARPGQYRGVLPLAPSFDVVGVLARRAALLGQVMEVLLASVGGGARPDDDPDGLRAIRLPGPGQPELAAAVRATAQAIAEACGCAVAECSLSSFSNEAVADLFARSRAGRSGQPMARGSAGNSQFLAPDVQSRVERAEALSRAGPDQADEQAWRSYPPRLDIVLPGDSVAVLPVIADLPPLRSAGPEELLAFRAGALRFTARPALARAAGTCRPGSPPAPAASDSVWASSDRSPRDLALLRDRARHLPGRYSAGRLDPASG